MFRKTTIGLAAVLTVVLAVLQSPASGSYPYPYYDAYSVPLGAVQPYSTYSNDYVPYFISHPPVYYGRVAARPYGYSPFPAAAGMLPAEAQLTRPVIIHNVYCLTTAETAAGVRSAPEPLRIKNPYAAK